MMADNEGRDPTNVGRVNIESDPAAAGTVNAAMPTWMVAGLVLLVAAIVLIPLALQSQNGAGDPVSAEAADPDVAVHEAVDAYLRAIGDDDWPRVYELTDPDSRPGSRSRWLAYRDSGHVHKCVGEPSGRPTIDLHTLDRGDGWAVVEATVWDESDAGRTCRVEVVEGASGWRVGDRLPRN